YSNPFSPPQALPTTSSPGCARSMLASPARTTGWSSTIRIWIVMAVSIVFVQAEEVPRPTSQGQRRRPRGGDRDMCALLWRTAEDESPGYILGALPHSDQTEPGAGSFRIEALAVIADGQGHRARSIF